MGQRGGGSSGSGQRPRAGLEKRGGAATATASASWSRHVVKLTALHALESLAEGCGPIATAVSEAGGALLCALLSEAAVRTSRSHALLPHVLLCLLALARTTEAAAQALRRAGCVEVAVTLLDLGAESDAARSDTPWLAAAHAPTRRCRGPPLAQGLELSLLGLTLWPWEERPRDERPREERP